MFSSGVIRVTCVSHYLTFDLLHIKANGTIQLISLELTTHLFDISPGLSYLYEISKKVTVVSVKNTKIKMVATYLNQNAF